MAKSKKASTASDMRPSVLPEHGNVLRTTAAEGNNIRNWRLFRGVATQEELAKLTKAHDPKGKGFSRVVILRLENGEARYSQHHADIIGRALRVHPRDLIWTNPYDAGDIFAVYAQLPEGMKRRAAKLIAGLKR